MFKENNKKLNYKVVMVESNQPDDYSANIETSLEDDNTVHFSVYNNPTLYKILTKTIEKYFS